MTETKCLFYINEGFKTWNDNMYSKDVLTDSGRRPSVCFILMEGFKIFFLLLRSINMNDSKYLKRPLDMYAYGVLAPSHGIMNYLKTVW